MPGGGQSFPPNCLRIVACLSALQALRGATKLELLSYLLRPQAEVSVPALEAMPALRQLWLPTTLPLQILSYFAGMSARQIFDVRQAFCRESSREEERFIVEVLALPS